MIADDDTRDAFEAAFATYKKTTTASDYAPPPEYKPIPRPHWRADRRSDTLDVDEAFRRIESADAYAHRMKNPVCTAQGVAHIWDNYKHRYGLWRDEGRNEMPYVRLAQCRLSTLQWHDLLNNINQTLTPKEVVTEGYESSLKTPVAYIVKAAEDASKRRRASVYKREEAVRFLRSQGIDYDALSVEEKARWRARTRVEKQYQRTYL